MSTSILALSPQKSDPCLRRGQSLCMSLTAAPHRCMFSDYHDLDVDLEPSSPDGRPPSSHGGNDSNDSDDSMDTVYSLPSFSSAASSSATSNELDELESIRSVLMASPAPSVYSLTSSLREQSFRREYGRELNSYSDVYRLPADDEEIARLDRQHRMFKIMMGPWVPPMEEALTPEPGITKCVLDLGCGSGAWIADVARAFPECAAVGVDLAPAQTQVMPSNCRIEVDDINLGLEHFYGGFDVVHARLISSGIKDYAGLIDQIAHCLRPRGLILLYEFDFRLYHPDKTVLAPWSATRSPHEAPYLCRWFLALSRAVRQRGGHVDAAALLHLWIRQHHNFAEEDIEYKEYWCPVGPWEHRVEWGDLGDYSKEVGEMMRDDIGIFLLSGRPLLLGSGMHPEDLHILETNAQTEMNELRVPMFVKIQCVYARKKAVG